MWKQIASAIAMAVIAAPASAAVTNFNVGTVNNSMPDYVTNDISIDFENQWSGSQILLTLSAGSLFQDPNGFNGNNVPSQSLANSFDGVKYDSFVTGGGPTDASSVSVNLGGGAVDLGGASAANFAVNPASQINQAWNPAAGTNPTNGTDFLTARLTLSDDAAGTWQYLASDGDISTTGGTINNGTMAIPEPASAVLLGLGGLGLLRRRRRAA